MTTLTFTEKELAVLHDLYLSMKGNGFDFGYLDDCRGGLTGRTAGGVLRGLHKKLRWWVDDSFGQVYWEGCSEIPSDATFEQWLELVPRS